MSIESTTLSIGTAGVHDMHDLLSLYRHLHPGDPVLSEGDGRRILDRLHLYPGSAVFLGRLAGAPVASCTLVVVPNLTRGGQSYGVIENVVTDAAYRRRGFGAAVLNAAIASAWDHGCYKVMLLTGSTDPATLRFYGDAGFEQSKTGFQIRRPLDDKAPSPSR